MASNQMLGGSAVGTIPTTLGSVGGGGGSGGNGAPGAPGASGPTGVTGPTGVEGPTGPTGPVAGSDTQIIFNKSGAAGATGLLTFNYTTGTLTTSGFAVTGAMASSLNMNLCNISNVGTGGYSSNAGQMALSFTVPPTSTTISGSYTYYVCTTSCTIIPNYSVNGVVFFAVGGGAAGAYHVGGGGGAGGLQTNIQSLCGSILPSQYVTSASSGLSLTAGSNYVVSLGVGGIGNNANFTRGAVGGNTTFSGFGITPTITASGGGGGGSPGQAGTTGGCGGGGGNGNGSPGAVDISGGIGLQGYNGGTGYGVGGGAYPSGGGGGIGGQGGNATSTTAGSGGAGLLFLGTTYGVGGAGDSNTTPASGSANTGSGGGGNTGGGNTAGSGGSGVFILGIPTAQVQLFNAVQFASIAINPSSNLQITASNNIIFNPSTGGNVTVSSGGFSVPAGTTTLSSLTVTNNVSVGGTATLRSLAVTNATTLSSLTVTANASLQGLTTLSGLTVTNATTLSSLTVTANASLQGLTTLSGLTVTNATTLSSLTVTGTTSMSGTLNMNLCNISNVGTGVYSILDVTSSANFLATSTVNSINTLCSSILTWIDCLYGTVSAGGFTDRAGVSWTKTGTPTLGTYSLNGTPVLATTANNFFTGTWNQTAHPLAMFWVFMFPNGINAAGTSVSPTITVAGGSNAEYNSGFFSNQLAWGWSGANKIGSTVNLVTNPSYSIATSTTAGRIFSLINSSASSVSNAINIDGVGLPLNPNTTNGGNSTGSVSVALGSYAAAGFGLGIAEFLIYNCEFTTSQTQTIEGYLAWKWGLQAQLPITHPYASAAPYASPQILPRGSIAINAGSNLQITASNNIVFAPATGSNVTVSGALSTTGTATVSSLVVLYNASLQGVTTLSSLAVTNSTTLSSLTVNSLAATTMTGNLNMNLCNILNMGSNSFSLIAASVPAFVFSPSAPSISGSYGSYTYFIFTASTTTVTTNYAVTNVKYFAIGGGGGGGTDVGGGGGAGGLQTNDSDLSGTILSTQYNSANANLTLQIGTFTVTVGASGAGAASLGVNGTNGGNTVFSGTGGISITAYGGGGGGGGSNGAAYVGSDGGCGGGGGQCRKAPGI